LFFLGSLASFPDGEMTFFIPIGVCGFALLVNVVLSLISEEPEEIKEKGGKFY
jgi:hypothetical protein